MLVAMRARRDSEVGSAFRVALAPISEHLGLDFDASSFSSPASAEARAFEGLRVGVQALYDYTYPDAWSEPGGSRRDRRRAAKIIADSLATDDGRDAACYMADRVGGTLAALWRAHAEGGQVEDPDNLRDRAAASEGLSSLVRAAWLIEPDDELLTRIRHAEDARFFDPENPYARFDLRAYVMLVGAVARALALAAGPHFPAVERLVIHPVMSVDITYYAQLPAARNQWALYWMNLLAREPLPFADVLGAARIHEA